MNTSTLTSDAETMPLRDAVERVLADRAATEPGFVEELVLDPKGVIQPIITQLVGDDGELDLTDANINVHIQTPKAAHFVLATAGIDEVTGYAASLDFGQLLGLPVRPGRILGADGEKTDGTETTCNTSASCCPTNCKPPSALKSW